MLVIHQAQIDALGAGADEAFAGPILGWLRRQRHSPVGDIDDAVLLGDIRRAMNAARARGLTWESTVADSCG